MGGIGIARLRLSVGNPGRVMLNDGSPGNVGSPGIGGIGIARLRLSVGSPGSVMLNDGNPGSVGSPGIGGIGIARLILRSGKAQFDISRQCPYSPVVCPRESAAG